MNEWRGPRRLAAALLVVVVGALLAGCGGYYYRGTVQGFVIDDETEAGINEATVRIYEKEIDDASAEGYVAQTATVTQGGNAGYYSSTVIWRELFGAYGQEGDTTTLWVSVDHPDYGSAIVAAQGILSDEDNLVATIRLTQTSYSLAAVRGRVIDSNGAGVNGVRLALDLPVVSGTDDDEDYVTQTATVDGVPGTWEIAPVEWSDANTSAASGELNAVVRVDDPEWGADTSAIAAPVSEDFLVERTITLVPGTQTRVVSGELEVFRRPRTEFTAAVTGRLVWLAGPDEDERPVQGVRVRLSYSLSSDDPDTPDPYRTLVDYTDAGGTYEITVGWTDLAPGDYDDADERSGAVISPVAGATDGIAAGEDGLLVTIAYDDLAVPGGILGFSGQSGEYRISSAPRGGANRLPDVFQVPTTP